MSNVFTKERKMEKPSPQRVHAGWSQEKRSAQRSCSLGDGSRDTQTVLHSYTHTPRVYSALIIWAMRGELRVCGFMRCDRVLNEIIFDP